MKAPILAAALTLLAASPALAHAMLQHASPAAADAVHPAPKTVTLQFSERLEPSFSKLEVHAADGTAQTTATNIAGTTMKAILKPLTPGTYKVVWHAVSIDTHITDGHYTFTVKP